MVDFPLEYIEGVPGNKDARIIFQSKRDKQNTFVVPFFPDSIEDSKSVNWSEKEIPGGSHPLYQWVSSGAREISFDIVLYKDHQDANTPEVDDQVAWIRQFQYPEYDSQTTVTRSPGLLKVHFPTEMNLFPSGQSSVLQNVMDGILMDAGVTWDDWFRNGQVRAASVSLSFVEVIQRNEGGTSSIDFQDRNSFDNDNVNTRRI